MSGTLPGVRMPDMPILDPVTSGSTLLSSKDGFSGNHSIDAVTAYISSQNVPIPQLQAAITALQADVSALKSINGYRRLSQTTVTAPTPSVIIALPDGWGRYRIEFEGINGQGAVGQLQMRPSADGSNFVATAGSFGGIVTDADGSTVQSFNMALATAALISGNHMNTAEGICGSMDYNSIRTHCLFRASYVNPVAPTRFYRDGMVAHPIGRWVSFFMNGGTVNLAAGARFDVLARP